MIIPAPSANKPWTMKVVNVQLQLNHRTIHPMLRPHPHTNPDFLPRGLQGYHIHPGGFRNCCLPMFSAASKVGLSWLFLLGIFQPVEIRFHGDDTGRAFEFLFPRLCCPLQKLFLRTFACGNVCKTFLVLTAVRRKHIITFLSLCPHLRCPNHSAWLTVRPERTVAVICS